MKLCSGHSWNRLVIIYMLVEAKLCVLKRNRKSLWHPAITEKGLGVRNHLLCYWEKTKNDCHIWNRCIIIFKWCIKWCYKFRFFHLKYSAITWLLSFKMSYAADNTYITSIFPLIFIDSITQMSFIYYKLFIDRYQNIPKINFIVFYTGYQDMQQIFQQVLSKRVIILISLWKFNLGE